MACNTVSIATSSVTGVTAFAPLSAASSPFVASSAPAMLAASSPCLVSSAPAMLAPLSTHTPLKSLSVSCGLSEKDSAANISKGKVLLTGLVAVGAALSVFTADTASAPAAFAASGPGNSGAERTAEKANDLLKAADKLTVDDSPQRFGPGRVSGGNQDSGKVAQEAAGNTASQIQGGISSIADTFSGKQGDVQGAAQDAAGQAKSKVDEVTGSGGAGGLFNSLNSSLKDTVQGIKESVSQKDGDAKKALDEASSTVQNKLQ